MLTVGEVVKLSGVTVRTLHHYDEEQLLCPSARSDAGYRLYSDTDIARLQQILTYRELGFELDTIKQLLDDPDTDALAHLRDQRELLINRIDRLRDMVAAVELTMEARQMSINLTPEDMLEVFGDRDPTEHDAEAAQRWGDTDAYTQSQRRTSRMTKDDWKLMGEQSEVIEHRLADLMAGGVAADAADAMDAAEAHRRHISTWFYDCSPVMHSGLAEMYVADERFRAHYDDRAPGLAAYVHDAILANAARQT